MKKTPIAKAPGTDEAKFKTYRVDKNGVTARPATAEEIERLLQKRAQYGYSDTSKPVDNADLSPARRLFFKMGGEKRVFEKITISGIDVYAQKFDNAKFEQFAAWTGRASDLTFDWGDANEIYAFSAATLHVGITADEAGTIPFFTPKDAREYVESQSDEIVAVVEQMKAAVYRLNPLLIQPLQLTAAQQSAVEAHEKKDASGG